MNMRYHRPLHTPLQQRAEHGDSRQQQQDNGTHEFQPMAQQGDSSGHDDQSHTLAAYLERARQVGDMPSPRTPGSAPQRRVDLRLAK
ncbi:hypothetical protein [Pseudorhodoferax sp. Leaf267]|uniref:hypothetical protein n=1 Tax=Pseudorhodoferax sp. Leaf267 TaxID=1736316 RepID=UPI0007148D78|nr:hypothetical protein [Pseudorhodoferax sp. Leaf267]KQP13630.1 hypothetical protein ASF43_17120 [Pseudorhodoferax sp. Leaf267]